MDVAVLYSGGKDSTYAIAYCIQKGWNIKYLLSVKPTRKDCFLFHFATVEHTPKLAEILGLKHILVSCDVADPVKEADIVRKAVEEQQKINPVEAVVLGGTGLQETQIRSVQNALKPFKIEAFAAHAGLDHDKLMEEMLNNGYKFMITQVASDGLMQWLGKIITKDNVQELLEDSRRYGFAGGGDGGYYDSLTLSGPIFGDKEFSVQDTEKVVDDQYCGHINVNKLEVLNNLTVSH